jgi:hypothetical protein
MRKKSYLLAVVAMLAVLAALTGCLFVPVEYEETLTTVGPGEQMRVEIDVSTSQVLEGSWTAVGDIQGSYAGPNDENRAWQSSSGKNDFTITGEYNPGLYAFKFLNVGSEDAQVTFRFRFQ